jgi:hypothetical protein
MSEKTLEKTFIEKCILNVNKNIEDETLTFMVEEIFQNQKQILVSKENLNELLSEHLVNFEIVEEEEKSMIFSEDLYDELLKEEEIEEEEQEINSDEDFDDGTCVLCSRIMPLTFHHLIPRTTHKKLKKRGFKIKELNVGIMVCRPCHSAIHRFIDEEQMASDYNTYEKLIQHEKVQSWIPYAMKQKVVLEPQKKYKK